MEQNEIDRLAQRIWDYHHLNHDLEKADCIVVLGSHDTRVAGRGAELFLAELAPLIVFSGGLGRLTSGIWTKSEAEIFADIAMRMGVPKEKILIENESTNTGDNCRFSFKRLAETGIHPARSILVQKPYMERRTYATFKKIFPEKECLVTSPQISFSDYCTGQYKKDDLIDIMVGDLQRIREYPAKGFQIAQEIPDDVWAAYEELVAAGYDKHLIK
ncbi:MAG: YdcF family protein [Elusimicrobia bacterium]|nr:YdcF family protein [Elusimicrobiota bacterium]